MSRTLACQEEEPASLRPGACTSAYVVPHGRIVSLSLEADTILGANAGGVPSVAAWRTPT